jgi:hypothetical protein
MLHPLPYMSHCLPQGSNPGLTHNDLWPGPFPPLSLLPTWSKAVNNLHLASAPISSLVALNSLLPAFNHSLPQQQQLSLEKQIRFCHSFLKPSKDFHNFLGWKQNPIQYMIGISARSWIIWSLPTSLATNQFLSVSPNTLHPLPTCRTSNKMLPLSRKSFLHILHCTALLVNFH